MSRHSLRADDSDIIKRYSDMVYRMAYSLLKSKHDAEDVHQEVFIRYLKRHPVFEGSEHEKAWFLRVTINFCKNFRKTVWARHVVSFGDSEFFETEAVGTAWEQEEEDAIIGIVKQLSQKYRIVIHLFYYEELTVEEIARVQKLKPSTVRVHLTRARAKLRTLLECPETKLK